MKPRFPAPYAHPPLKVTYYVDKNPAPAPAMKWVFPREQ